MEELEKSIRSQTLELNSLLAGRFKITKKLASGGMGNVYQAIDTKAGDFVLAVKVLHQEYRNNRQYFERFKREVQLCKEISHPNVVKIFDLFVTSEDVFYSMEHIAGESLEDRLDRGPLPAHLVSKLLIEICDGLRVIHQAGIIHRDLKPGNIMMQPDGSAKIIDFGISRDENSRLTTKNLKVGSVSFMAPELWEGKKPTAQVDFYALGCLLCEICSGDVPFDAPNPLDLMKLHQEGKPPILPIDYPIWVEELMNWLMAKKPEERPKNCEEIIEYLRSNCDHSSVVQTFTGQMQEQTIRSGSAMMTVFPPVGKKRDSASVSKANLKGMPQHSLMLSLRATRTEKDQINLDAHKNRRSKTVILKLPRNAALVFELELPSKDFIFLGVFLASLNIFDGYLTKQGMDTFGVHAEGNGILRSYMHQFGPDATLLVAKIIAIGLVLVLTIAARKSKLVKNLVGTLSIIYLFAAVLPWMYILYYR